MHIARRRRKLTEVSIGCDDEETYEPKLHKDDEDDEPFLYLLLRVGGMVGLVFVVIGLAYVHFIGPILTDGTPVTGADDDDFTFAVDTPNEKVQVAEPEAVTMTAPPLPQFPPLSAYAQHHDAFAVVENRSTESKDALFWQTANGLREQFAERYGSGSVAVARSVLDAAMTAYGKDHLSSMACRIQRAREEHRTFRMAFGGYSVTAGHGNYFSQSFPMVLERILGTVFQVIGMSLEVRNAAVGGCPSFPYGWCLENFLGDDPDVVSWDFSMNEAGDDPVGLESYVRHVVHTFPRAQLLVKDTHMAENRRKVLEDYAAILRDPLVVHTEPAVEPFLDLEEAYRPDGFRAWRKFGSPQGAPGQTLHHPAVKEHEFIAWILALHFLSALEVMIDGQITDCSRVFASHEQPSTFPQPFHLDDDIAHGKSLFFGSPHGSSWTMSNVQCRTSFQPTVKGDLKEIVESGGVAQNMNVMLPKSNMYYGRGWVFDLSESEKKAKRKLDRFKGLGFLDKKPAFYGIYSSGSLVLQLPVRRKLKSVVVCAVNEIRPQEVCDNAKDIQYTIAGLNVSAVPLEHSPTLYLGKSVCTYLEAPNATAMSCRDDSLCTANLTLSVRNQHINRKEQACSISHVIWEENTIFEPIAIKQQG